MRHSSLRTFLNQGCRNFTYVHPLVPGQLKDGPAVGDEILLFDSGHVAEDCVDDLRTEDWKVGTEQYQQKDNDGDVTVAI